MTIRTLALPHALAAILSTLGAADAQTQIGPRPPEQRISITVQTSMNFPGSTATQEDETALQAKARTAFYTIAAGECATISAALNGDCRPGTISVTTRTVEVRPGLAAQTPGVTVSGSMSFTVTPR